MTEHWNLQTNLKNKPNAQGTLFSGGTSQMNPAKRYPRGYTPERQREIYRSMGYGVRDHTDSYPRLKQNGDDVPSRKQLDMEEVIKRSTVPKEHVKSLEIHIVDKHDGEDWGVTNDHEHSLNENVWGQYHPTAFKRVTNVPPGSVWGSEKRVAIAGQINIDHRAGDFTLLHEIGHHASAVQGLPHSNYGDPRQRGEEEGHADAYADQHTPLRRTAAERRQQADLRRGRANYEPLDDQTSDGGFSGRMHFEAGYNHVRPLDSRVPNTTDVRQAASSKAFEDNLKRAVQKPLF